MDDIVLIGYGGHAKSIADTIERTCRYNIVGYTDFSDYSTKYKYLGNDDELNSIFQSGVTNAIIGVGYLGKGTLREELYLKLKHIGFNLPPIIDPSAIVSDSAMIGEGTFVGKNCVINADAKIGTNCIINTGAIVEHECIVDDFVHVSVGAVVCGGVAIDRGAFVGANATIIQCRHVRGYEIVPAGKVLR